VWRVSDRLLNNYRRPSGKRKKASQIDGNKSYGNKVNCSTAQRILDNMKVEV
jgi:hypothetical protein